jgi:integrase/recombinase XerD
MGDSPYFPSVTVSVPVIPTVTIHVRHSSDCPRKADPFCKNCKCPKHLRWSYGGKQYRQSAKTRTWAIAEQVRRRIESQFETTDPARVLGAVSVQAYSRPTIERAIQLLVSDKRSQGLSIVVLKKYELELGRFKEYMGLRSRFFPYEITQEILTEFRAGWDKLYPSSTTRVKVQERLRGFLRYCY